MSKAILLVEDDASDEKLTLLALKRCGAADDVFVVRDGAAALDYLFATGPFAGRDPAALPKVVLLDLKLPKVDGLDVLRRVRAHDRTKLVPIVVLTASKEEEDILRSYAFGANAYIRKPVEFAAFGEAAKTLSDFWLRLNERAPVPPATIGKEGAAPRSAPSSPATRPTSSEPLRVLLVEDSATDAKLVVQELRRMGRPIEFERVETPEAMRAALEGKRWDLVTSDWSMPKFSARAALSLLGEMQVDIPFILVSGTVGEENAVAAVRAGARDYVLKDALGRLTPAVERELREHESRQARRRAESARAEAELWFRRLFDSGIIGVTVAEVSGAIREANDEFLRMVGHSRKDLVAGALDWRRMTPLEWREVTERAGEELRARGSADPYEKEYVRRDGTRVPVLVGLALLDESRVLTVVTDLTARKAAEHAKVLLEEQLRQSQKMEAVGRLAGGIAHDFNNMLSVVLSYAGLLLSDLKEDDPVREDVEEIRRAGLRAADLTRQLLMFSRQQVLDPRVLDLGEILSAMSKMLGRVLGEDIELVFSPGESLGRVRADPGSIEQLVMNLAVNARDAMPAGGKLTIETATVELDEAYVQLHLDATPGSYVMLTVSDTGCGMDRETQARIFEPFFTTKEKGRGTGLGLSTVFGIVQQSGGNIWVYSEPGRGTTFKIHLPRIDAAADPPERERAAVSLRGTETILLVEDEDQVRDVARGILERHGYRVLAARGASEALRICEEHADPIQLLLSDIVMPETSGPELAKNVVAARPEIRVLYMSGYTDDAAVRHGVIDATFAYLQKPFTVETLTRKVRAVLDGA